MAVLLAWLAAVDESVEEPVAAIRKWLSFFLALEVVSSVVRQLNTQKVKSVTSFLTQKVFLDLVLALAPLLDWARNQRKKVVA